MRGLQTHDLFVAMKIVNAAGIKEEVERIALKASNSKLNEKELGADLILSVLGGCADEKAEKLIYDFFGGLLEIQPDVIKTMNPLELFDEIKKLNEVIDVEAWRNFFHLLVASTMKSN